MLRFGTRVALCTYYDTPPPKTLRSNWCVVQGVVFRCIWCGWIQSVGIQLFCNASTLGLVVKYAYSPCLVQAVWSASGYSCWWKAAAWQVLFWLGAATFCISPQCSGGSLNPKWFRKWETTSLLIQFLQLPSQFFPNYKNSNLNTMCIDISSS